MKIFKIKNDTFFRNTIDYSLNFLNNLSYNVSETISFDFDEIVIIQNYFEDEHTYSYVENLCISNNLHITYFPRTNKNTISYAFLTKSKFIYDKLHAYLNIYKHKILAIYDFPNYWDIQWKMTIMCERICEKSMNDTCMELYDTTIIPVDFISTVHGNVRTEHKENIQQYVNFSNKIICSESVTKLLRKNNININPENIILHPHVWGTDNTFNMDEIENAYGYKIPFKNMCYMSNVQTYLKKENSFIGFYIHKPNLIPNKSNDIMLWGKDIDLVLGKSDLDFKINLIDKLCEKYTVNVTVENSRHPHNGQFDEIKSRLKNNHNFYNYNILDRDEYLEELKNHKIFISLNEYVQESLGYLEALSNGCHVIAPKNFHTAVTHSEDINIRKMYSEYNTIQEIESKVNDVMFNDKFESVTLKIFEKFHYINRIINICNGKHETTGVIYV